MKTKLMVICSLFSAILCCLAFIQLTIPFTTIPITLQTLGVCIVGAVLGKKYGTISVVIYVLMGLCGIPVFAGMTGGMAVLVGPTGGYILGFILSAFVIGYLCEKLYKRNDTILSKYIKVFISMIVGLIVVYIFGTIQFMLVSKITLLEALVLAVIPFVPLDIIKIIVGTVITLFIKSRVYDFS